MTASYVTLAITSAILIAICALAWKSIRRPDDRKRFWIFVAITMMTIPTAPVLWHHSYESLHLVVSDPAANGRKALLFLHIILAIPCTLLGAPLFFKPFRNRYLNFHRQLGKIYVIGTLLSAVLVLPLAMTNRGGPIPQFGFSTMALFWFVFTLKGYIAIRKGDLADHRIWMMRSYAMTFAFVHVNVTYNLFDVYDWVGNESGKVKVLQSYVSWMFNLTVVEAYERTLKLSKKRRRSSRQLAQNA